MALGTVPAGWTQTPSGLFAPQIPPTTVNLLEQIQRGVYGGAGGLYGNGIPAVNSFGSPVINPGYPVGTGMQVLPDGTMVSLATRGRVVLANNHRSPYGTIMPDLPYAAETPLTDEILAARARQGAMGVRGVMRNSGPGYMADTGYPRQIALPQAAGPTGQGYATPLLTEVQQGVYGGNPSAINANVIPVAEPSQIPMMPVGQMRGTTAASMPYAQWEQASDDLVNSVSRQGPYMGTRGWARNSGPSYMAESGYPRQLALPQYADQIPSQNIGAAGAANPSSIPQGAGAGTLATDLPYADQAMAMGRATEGVSPLARAAGVAETPVGIRGLRSQMTPAQLLADSGIGTRSMGAVTGATDDLLAGKPWTAYQGAGALPGTGAAGFPVAETAASGALAGLPAAEAAAGRFASSGGLRAAAGEVFSPKGAGLKGAAGRFALGLGIGTAAGRAADRLGGSETIPGQFMEGVKYGGGFGSAGGVPGAIVGGLGVGIGNVASHAIQGRGIESITGGGEGEIADTPLGNYMRSQMVTGPDGSDSLTDQGAIVAALVGESPTGNNNIFAQLGMDSATADEMKARINADLAATDSQDERVNVLKKAADELVQYATGGGAAGGMGAGGSMSPADLAAMQVAASQIMAPVAADSMALGQMQSAALNSLSDSLPEAYRPVVANMANQITPRSQQVANAYIQQATAMPQLNVLDSYQNQVDQTAQQLTAQALSQVMPNSGATDFASLVANAGGSSADIVNQLAGLGQ